MAPGPASPCSVLMSLMNPWLGWLLALTDVFSCCSALLRTRLSRFFFWEAGSHVVLVFF